MASRQASIDYLLEQIAGAGAVSAKKMFGEYGLYCDGKLVGLVCDDQLFVKPTAAGRAYLGTFVEKPPYSNAKPCFLVPTDRWDEDEWLTQLIRVSAAELPLPHKKPRKGKTA